MNLESDPMPPVPQQTSPILKDKVGLDKFHPAWLGWFVQVREKLNLINASLQNLSSLVTGGFATKDPAGAWVSRSITGTTNRVTVTNGDGISGNPAIDIASTYLGQASITTVGTISTGTWEGDVIANAFLDAAAKMSATSTSAVGGAATALPAQPVGYVEIKVGLLTKKIPYYD